MLHRPPRLRRLLTAVTLGAVGLAAGASPAHAVIGGTQTAEGAAPWIVALIDAQTGKKTVAAGQFCAATLVAPKLLVTAAHCVSDDDGYKTASSDIKVFTGTSLPLRKAPLLSVGRVRVFAKYQDGAGETNGDIATIQLKKAITDRTPLALPTPDEAGALVAGTPLHLWGWGNRAGGEFENYPRQLQDGEVIRYSDAQCDGFYGRFFNPAAQLCAGQDDGHVDACQGDSGGPLTGIKADGTPVLAGIVSYGEGCGVPSFPTVYTKPARYRTFLARSLKLAARPAARSGRREGRGGRRAARREAAKQGAGRAQSRPHQRD